MTMSLQQLLKTGQLPQSLLLIGATLSDALDLSKKLLGDSHAPKIDSGNHPDLHIYAPEGKGLLHPVANIQKLIKEMALPPFESALKIFIIDEAEKMLPAASNALLKTLEEPADDTYLILLSDYPDHLLPTIISRLSPITFPSKEQASFDMSPYFELARLGEWDTLLDRLQELEEEDPQALFKSCLEIAAKSRDPKKFVQMSNLVAEGQKALNHHVKLRNVLLSILLK